MVSSSSARVEVIENRRSESPSSANLAVEPRRDVAIDQSQIRPGPGHVGAAGDSSRQLTLRRAEQGEEFGGLQTREISAQPRSAVGGELHGQVARRAAA